MTNRFLISVAAAALIAGTGFANAQGQEWVATRDPLVPPRSRARLLPSAVAPPQAARCNVIAAARRA